MAWYVDGYIEAGMSASGGVTPYLAFVSQSKTDGAKNLAGPFPTQAAAQAWADSYNKNPHNPKAGNDLSKSGSIATNDQPPSVPDILGKVNASNLILRVAEIGLGLVLIAVGVAKLTTAVPVATKIARAVT